MTHLHRSVKSRNDIAFQCRPDEEHSPMMKHVTERGDEGRYRNEKHVECLPGLPDIYLEGPIPHPPQPLSPATPWTSFYLWHGGTPALESLYWPALPAALLAGPPGGLGLETAVMACVAVAATAFAAERTAC
ncbi:hypothetical protein NDU88_006026 [Pleurodeles waltl]|uniref:Uncharacterized protein n=1 Tax=Pleurodeles waltl TaxID=8319 RepID=A0AAV7SNG4_PLEWA|nr:hypothetical protein NDU88_006026 [Pleurodeles waltl]